MDEGKGGLDNLESKWLLLMGFVPFGPKATTGLLGERGSEHKASLYCHLTDFVQLYQLSTAVEQRSQSLVA